MAEKSHVKKSHTAKNSLQSHNRFRLAIQIAWLALTNGYIRGFASSPVHIYSGALKNICVPGLNCYSCPGALFACPVGSLQAVLSGGMFKFSAYVFGMLAFFGTICGRAICAFLCPFGLVQELIYRIPFFKKRKNFPAHKILVWMRYVVLALFVIILPLTAIDEFGMGLPWFCKYICPSGTLLAGIPLVAGNEALRSAVGILFSWKMCVLLFFLLVSLWTWRPFCKYVCPLGALYGLFNRVAIYKFKIDTEKCTECGACQRVCKADIKVWKNPNSADCIRCGDCVHSCPVNAIKTFSKNII